MITYHGRHGDCQPLQYPSSCSHGPVGRLLGVKGKAEADRPQAGGYNTGKIAPVASKKL